MTRVVNVLIGVLVIMTPSALTRTRHHHQAGLSSIINVGYCYAFATHPIRHHHSRHNNQISSFSSLGTTFQQQQQQQQQYVYESTFYRKTTSISLFPRGGSSSFSTTSSSTTTSLHASTQLDHAKESLSIAGHNTPLKSFGGLTYRDTFESSEEFRVVFVLGGPGT
jgi:hypothetical protein